MEDFPFGNLDLNESYDSEYVVSPVWFFITVVIKMIILTIADGASIFLIYIILKFDRLKVKTNIFILHYAIACLIDMLCLPIIHLISLDIVYPRGILCIMYNLNSSACLMVVIFSTAISLYWFVENFHREPIQKYGNFQLHFTIILYLICTIKFIIMGSQCYFKTKFNNFFLISIYCIMLIIIIIVNIVTHLKKLSQIQLKTKYQLTISTYIILSYLPLLIYNEVLHLDLPENLYVIFEALVFIPEAFAYVNPIVVVYLLGRMDKYFKSSYNKIFKRGTRNYDDEDMDEESQNEEEIKDEVNITENIGDMNQSVVI